MKQLYNITFKLLFFLTIFFYGCEATNYGVTSEVISLAKGYGYQIKIEDKVVIQQAFIPVVEGNKPFCTEEDAKRTAELVVSKIIQKEGPAVTLDELEKLQIDFNCLLLL